MDFRCPARESSKFLCGRLAEYQINGTIWCGTHARRIIESGVINLAHNDAITTQSEGERYEVDTIPKQ